MENETREKLIAIIEQAQRDAKDTIGSMNNGFAAWCADKLLTPAEENERRNAVLGALGGA
jgi:protein involved in temperature-dependent protein secretion